MLGMLAGTVPWAFIAVSVLLSPWFNVYNNALSDLGNTSLNSSVAYIFDSGLIVTGLLAATFGLILSFRKKDRRFLIWSVPLTIASLDLSMIGAFNESMGRIHDVVSIVFFVAIVITMLLFGYASRSLSAPGLGVLSLVLGILSAVVWFAPWPWNGVALQETFTSALMAFMLISIAQRLC